MSNRPDFSDYLAHFTTNRVPYVQGSLNPTANIAVGLNARERLIRILEEGKIKASILPWTNRAAVCLTECPWSSLLAHSQRYSPYGLGFHKGRVFAAGGGPTYYVRADHYKKQQWEDDLHTFVTPFWPTYRPNKLKNEDFLDGKTIDYSHEREWRVPHDFEFQLSSIEFVIVNSYEDVAQFPKHLKDEIGREKFLIMDVYKQIERLWPVHQL